MPPDDAASVPAIAPVPGPAPVLPPDAARELDVWEEEMHRFLRGDLSPERFKAFRLAHGVYGQRQGGVQMIRVKIPAGILNSAQILRLADVAHSLANGVVHLTTRQDVQFYFVRLGNVPALLRAVAEVGLTTREACGNSVRNVTACPVSGFAADERFEVEPYARAAYSFLVRNPFCQQMARKFKISFSACPEDCAAAAIHDIGVLGRVLDSEGSRRCGFEIVVGGGLGPTPFLAKSLEEFTPVEELLPTLKAILQVYAELGNRRNRGKARLKFVVNRLGIERFRDRVVAARAALTAEEREEARLLAHVPEERRRLVASHLDGIAADRPRERGSDGAAGPGPTSPELERWRSASVRAHRDPDRAVVTVMVPLGDLDAPTFRAVARIVRELGDDHARIARDQNLVLPSVRRADLPALHRRLEELGLAEPGVGTALDVTSCPGGDTCRLGITSSKGLARAIRSELAPSSRNGGLAILRDVSIKISGCPNSCGQHHIASIGFHGVVKSFEGKEAPAYQLHVGGRAGDGRAAIGRALVKIPARNVPGATSALLRLFEGERSDGDSFADFVARVPDDRIRSLMAPFVEKLPPEPLRNLDWGKTEPFSTSDLGNGGGGAATADPGADPFDGYRAEILQALRFAEGGQHADALANLNRSQYTLARALLEALGKKPESDYEVACELRAHVIDRGYASDLWNEHHEEIAKALRTRLPDPATIRAIHRRSEDLLEEAARTLPILSSRKAEPGASSEIPG